MVLESIARRMTAAETTPAIGGRLLQSFDAFLVWIRGLLSMKGDDCGDAGANATAALTKPLLDRRPSSFRTCSDCAIRDQRKA